MNDMKKIMNDAKLKTLCYQKAQLIYGKQLPVEVLNRLQYELDIIGKEGGSDYFLFLQELVNTAQKKLGVLIGPGHTSIAGSLVAYCLGITKIDPLKYNLLFERFICPNRFAFPEVWIDVDKEGYVSILHWLEKRNVKMPEKNTIAFEGETVKGKGVFTTQLFVINALSEIKTVLSNIKQMQGIGVDIDDIPADDPSTIEIFQRGDTNGIFCFDTQGMQVNLRKMNPTRFSDLVLLYAMYRPGPMDYIPEMLDRKNENEKITYPIPYMEKYLQESYGLVVYQEQLMLLSQMIAGFSGSESDTLRKAIGKKMKESLSVIKPKFMEGGIRNGYEKETLECIWKEWEDIGLYAFMKAHAVCYTWLAYQMAYLKVHFPKEFGAMRKQVGLGSDIHEYDVVT